MTDTAQPLPPPSPQHRPLNSATRSTSHSINESVFDTPASELKVLKEQVLSSSPFGGALKAQEEMKDVANSVVYRPHYISKKREGEITREHEQYNLTYAMMIGIRHSVQSWEVAAGQLTKHKTLGSVSVQDMKKGVTSEHFSHVHKTYFPPEGGGGDLGSGLEHTPPHLLKGGFKFKDYAPEVFARLRKRFEIDDQDYLNSLCGSFNFLEFISNSKSGEFFFYSHDGRFMIKTQKRSESKFMLSTLPSYYNYVADNPNSMLVRVCGLHRVKMPQLRRKMHFVIMMSVYSEATEARPVNRIYDLKGATVGRRAGADEAVKKDLDIIEDDTKLHLGKKRQGFIAQVDRDSKFLASLGIMDYSLLVGIHGGPANQKRHLSQVGSFVFRSQRKSTLGSMGSHQNLLLQDGNASLDTVSGVNANPGGLVPSLPTTFSKHQIVRQSHDLPQISETPKNGLSSTLSKDKMAAEIAALRMAASETSQLPPTVTTSSAYRLSNVQGLNSFYKIDSPEASGITYHVGIIDIFTKYNIRKRGEHAFKVMGHGHGISAVAPLQYQRRFVKFISSLVEE
ncbi:hypothetical protein BASA81_002314 [Batrachochytrium salamandrivorans]|nr:hypothetical protein BASA81_002314 [Batrachochytrium salamandrivorans]